MSAPAPIRLSEDDARWLARMNRVIDARWQALQRLERPQEDEAATNSDHDAA